MKVTNGNRGEGGVCVASLRPCGRWMRKPPLTAAASSPRFLPLPPTLAAQEAAADVHMRASDPEQPGLDTKQTQSAEEDVRRPVHACSGRLGASSLSGPACHRAREGRASVSVFIQPSLAASLDQHVGGRRAACTRASFRRRLVPSPEEEEEERGRGARRRSEEEERGRGARRRSEEEERGGGARKRSEEEERGGGARSEE